MENQVSTGRLAKWNDDRGFGFIRPSGGQDDVFVHVSAFKKAGRRPVVGDVLEYQLHTDQQGRVRAVNAVIHGVMPPAPVPKPAHRVARRTPERGFPVLPALAVAVFVAGIYVYQKFDRVGVSPGVPEPVAASAPPASGTRKREPLFRCEGKVYCSQMTSCSEATFYQRHCPGTKMDGDHDGVPCERQWCN